MHSHFMQILFAGSFAVAALFKVVVASVSWVAVHVLGRQPHALLDFGALTQVAVFLAVGLLIAIWAEIRRKRDKEA